MKSTMTRAQLRARFGKTVDLTDACVREAIYAAITEGCPTNDPVRFPGGTKIPTPSAAELALVIRSLGGPCVEPLPGPYCEDGFDGPADERCGHCGRPPRKVTP